MVLQLGKEMPHLGDQPRNLAAEIDPEAIEGNRPRTPVGRIVLVVAPRIRRIAWACQMIEAPVRHPNAPTGGLVGDRLAEKIHDLETGQPGLFFRLPEHGGLWVFPMIDRAAWNLKPRFRRQRVTEDQQPRSVR